jgi:hypothetical protein
LRARPVTASFDTRRLQLVPRAEAEVMVP